MSHHPRAEAHSGDFVVVGIGASAGGVTALRRFFERVRSDSGMAFVVILHLSPEHESNLAALIQTGCPIPVMQVNESVTVEPNHVYVIPPTKYLVITDSVLNLAEPERIRGGHSSIDLFFRTLADTYGRNAVAVVLSGSGADGVMGLRRVKEQGGFAIAQNPDEAEYNSMPRAAIETGLVDMVLPVAEIPEKLLALRDGAQRLQLEPEIEKPPSGFADGVLRDILNLIRLRTGHEFHQYKRPTLLRRIGRRLQVHELPDLAAYLDFLREQPEEINALLRDLLITVTNFFRDHDCFDYLEREIIPGLLERKGADDGMRVWSVGCATGEEAYSLGILLLQAVVSRLDAPSIQVFATDIDEKALGEAREGVYPASITLDVNPDRLRQYFVHENDHYRVKKELREIVLFASHNVLRDPPFSKLDLICCRNLLIYLNREMQERVLGIFHFALRPDGVLFLGSSESAESTSAMFVPIDKKRRIYRRRQLIGSEQRTDLVSGKWQARLPDVPGASEGPISAGQLHQVLVEQIGPPSVLIDSEYDILHVSASAAKYLHFVGGAPSRNLLTVLHPDLRLELRASLLSARSDGRGQARQVRVELDGEPKTINLIVRSFLHPATGERRYYLVMFDEVAETTALGAEGNPELQPSTEGGIEIVTQLEAELQRTKEQLRVTIEQYETSTEELKASNEELQAINEELRSATEELETSKEELQSVNEELTTVNQELREKVEEVGHANSDLQNLMASTDIGTIFLDRALRIKRYTPRAQQLFNITPSDVGRPLRHFTSKLDYPALTEDAEAVLRTLQSSEREVYAADGAWFLTRMLPYRTLDEKIDGVVLTFVDITLRRQVEEERKRQADKMREQAEIVDMAHVLIRDSRDRIVLWNTGCEQLYGYSREEALEQNIEKLLKVEYPRPVAEIKAQIEATGQWQGEIVHTTKAGDRIAVASHWVLHRRGPGDEYVILEVNNDVTARRRAEAALREVDRQKDQFLAMLAHELYNPLGAILINAEVLRRTESRDANSAQALDAIDRQLKHLDRLVGDLLDVDRLSRGRLRLRKTRLDLETAISGGVGLCNAFIAEKSQHLSIKPPKRERLIVEGDEARLTQIVANLLDNAAKYTPREGHIEVKLERDGAEAVLSVEDDGAGIDPQVLSHVFEMFWQSTDSAVSSQRAGLGVGLALVRQLAELHGGQVRADSAGTGRGSRITVRLPLAEAVPRDSTEVGTTAAATHKKILVVDDNRDSADGLAALLSISGHDVRTAYNGPEALAAVRHHNPDIVFLDIGMPDMDGYETARRLKREHPGIVLVALSGWNRPEDRNRSREAGFDHHLAKPARNNEISEILEEPPPRRPTE